MAFTTTDRTNVQNAIIALATGTRKVSITWSSGNGSRTVQYGQANLTELQTLLAQIDAELAASTRSRSMLSTSRKGL